MPEIKVTNDKSLMDTEFESLRGTALYEAMFRNRMRLKNLGLNDTKDLVSRAVNAWLKEHCNSFYYFNARDPMFVYIEGDADATNFKMFFDGKDTADLADLVQPENGGYTDGLWERLRNG